MVCVGTAASGVGSLHFIEGIMNKNFYVNILREHLKNFEFKDNVQFTMAMAQNILHICKTVVPVQLP